MISGRIVKGIGGFYYIKAENKIIECKASGLFRLENKKPTIGDYVEVEITEENRGYITKISDRKNIFIRPPVSNVDQVFIICSIKNPDINYWLIDKMILLSKYNHMEPKIIITKSDLDEKSAESVMKDYSDLGFDVFSTSIIDEESIKKTEKILHKKTTCFMGVSGAGKSSLISAITKKEIETGAVSQKTGRGKHTTRHVELIEYENESYIFDTPGFSSFDLRFIKDKNEIKDAYSEFEKYSCKFNNCFHVNEPGCGVIEAYKNGEIKKFRYENYLSFLEEIEKRRY